VGTAAAAAVLGVVAALGLWSAPPAGAQDTGAVAVNTKDGSSVFKLAFSIKRVADSVVDPTNAAVAYASCDGCETVAVAIQVVLVTGDPSVVAPENVAIAVNDNCDLCTTMALAYQFVFGTGGEPVHFTQEGKAELHAIKKALKDLESADLTPEELQAQVALLAERVNRVVENEMVVGKKKDDAGTTASTAAATASTAPPTTQATATTEAPATTLAATTTEPPAPTTTVTTTG
jgi:putative peptide zinc metalloprotease protein